VFKRRTEQWDVLAKSLQARLDEQAHLLRVLSDAVTSLTVETGAAARESRGLELLIATQLDMMRGRLAGVAESCELLGERIEIDQLERRRLTEALIEATREHRNAPAAGRRKVGVTVFAIEDDVLLEPHALGRSSEWREVSDEPGSRSPSTPPAAK
jgi:hypothetical protein